MAELMFETIIASPHAVVWDKLRDLRVARHYVPGVTAIEFNTAQREGVGASRKVFMKKRAPVDETAIAWDEGRSFTLKIHHGDKAPAPFKWATFRYAIEDAGRDTRVRGTFAYEMAWGLAGLMLETVAVRSAIARTNTMIAANMKKYYETGYSANGLTD